MTRTSKLRIAGIVLGALGLLAGVAYFRLVRFARPTAPQLAGTFEHDRLTVGDRERSFAVYLPAHRARQAPLVIALHGSGETGDEFRWHAGYDFDRLADAHGFVVAYPDGYQRHWDDCRAAAKYSARTEHIDDVAFMHALIRHLHETVGIDAAAVFAVGHSNGGQMAYRLALEDPNDFRAVAAISAGLPVPDNLDCRPSGKAVSVLIMNGTDDPLNPYDGGRVTIFGFGNRGDVRSSLDSARYFADLAGRLPPTPPTSTLRLPGGDDTVWVERSSWRGERGVEIVLDTIHGGGHVVPQAYARYPGMLGRTAEWFDGPGEVWRFFAERIGGGSGG